MQTGTAIFPFIDQPNTRRPGLVFKLLPWRRPAIWAPFVDAVYAVRNFFSDGVDEVPTARVAQNSQKEPMNMPVAKAKVLLPEAEATSSSARLDAAVRKAASAKAKARDAKAALKKAKKGFRLARKAAKAARKELDALQAAITRAEEKAQKRARATRRAPKTDLSRAAANATSRSPVTPKPVPKTRRASSSTHPGADVAYAEALATPTDCRGGMIPPA